MSSRLAHPALLFSSILLLLAATFFTGQGPIHAGPGCDGRSFRLPLTVSANGVARSDKVVAVDVDFAAALQALGRAGSFSEASLCVVEVNAGGQVGHTAVPFQFDNGSTPDHPAGTLLFLLDGGTPAGASRTFHVYFDTSSAFTPPTFTDRVVRQPDAGYRGQSSFIIFTYDGDGAQNAAYFYHKTGGGFAGLYDRDGNDWISFFPTEGSRSGGEFRGIPNLGKVFHPGYSAASGDKQGSNSAVLADGPLRLTIRSVSKDGQWEALWHIYPGYAQMTLVRLPGGEKYWFLYEGTPGGQFDYSGAVVDTMVTSANVTVSANETHNAPLNPQWVYFADGVIERALFLAHENDDDIMDSFRKQDDFPGNGSDGDAMTVFGFGRDLTKGITRLLHAPAATFTFGLMETRDFTAAAAIINNAYREAPVIVGNEPPQLAANTGLTVDEGATAVLTPSHLAATDPEGGVITYTLTLPPAHGALLRNGAPLQANDAFTQDEIDSGALAYAHDDSETTGDSFAFTISDGVQNTGAAQFQVAITPINDAPLALPDSAQVYSGHSVAINLLQNDSDADGPALFVTALTQPAHGRLVNNGGGVVTYSAFPGFAGSDSFTYRAGDGEKQSAITTVTITVLEAEHIFLPLVNRPSFTD